MTGLSSAGEAAILVPLTADTFVSLHTGDPGNTGLNEVAFANGYARQGPIPFTNTGGNPTVASNNVIVTYSTATANWGTIGFFGLWTAPIGGTFLGSGPLATPRAVNNGDAARWPVGSLTLTAQ